MTLADALDLSTNDLKNMNIKELRQTAKTLFSGLNKRVKRLETAIKKGENIAEDALSKVRREGGKFKSGDKDKDRLINEIRRAQRFGRMETSTIKGAKKVAEERKGEGITGRETSIINTWLRMIDEGEVVYRTRSEVVAQVKGYSEVVSDLDFSEYTDEEIVRMIDNGWEKPGDKVGEDSGWQEMGDSDDEFWD